MNQKMKNLPVLLLLLSFWITSPGQNKPFVVLPEQLNDDRFAEWIAPKEVYGVFYFRRTVDLDEIPEQFIVHSSADARYRLYVNGQLVTWGPAAGDTENWYYETTDIAPFLKSGKNILASQVWNRGSQNGARQTSVRTAFILQGNSTEEQITNTGKEWKVLKDEGYHTLEMKDAIVGGGYIAAGTDSLIAALHPYEWHQLSFDDSDWAPAVEIGKGNHAGLDTWKGTAWKLQPRMVPPMEQKMEATPRLLEVKGMPYPKKPEGNLSMEIPPNHRVEILLDNEVMTMGFPRLRVSGGKDSKIKIQYQESLFNENGTKGNRNEWQGKIMKGYYDIYVTDGQERLFEPLWIRVFRYVKLTVETGDAPLQIKSFSNLYTAYPLEQKGKFTVNDELLSSIWDTSWRTLRLCALETYMDCPYYEQVQYIGDSRIQALISMYVAGDDRLAENAIRQFYNSMQPMGLTKSAHPTGGVQIIPPYSLYFIAMVHDYYMLRDNREFISQFLPGVKFILEWFIGRIDKNGMTGPLPYWNHVDNGTGFINGSPPGISEGGSAHMSILLAYTLDKAAELLTDFNYPCDADRYLELSESLKQKTMEHCFNSDRQLIAETPAQDKFSQHTNSFAILAGMFDAEQQKALAQQMLNDPSLIQTTLYFKFYLFQALKKSGMGELVIDQMQEWKKFLDAGLTTFPEHGINSRSDCHAWSAHPMHAFTTITCGIEPASPGFKTVEIKPAPGNLASFNGTVPHPLGEIAVSYNSKNRNKYSVHLPKGLTGTFILGETPYPLTEGENVFK